MADNINWTFEQFLVKVSYVKKQQPSWRMGQTFYNVLLDIKPRFAKIVIGSPNLDPFDRDENIGEFLAFICQNWDLVNND